MQVIKRNGQRQNLDIQKIHQAVEWACGKLEVSQSAIETGAHIQFFDGIKTSQIHNALVGSAASLIDKDAPDYEYAAARLVLQQIYKEVTDGKVEYPTLRSYIEKGVAIGRLDERLLAFDLEALNEVIDADRDLQFKYLGMQTIYDRYLLRTNPEGGSKQGKVIEMPQHLWMRIAMGLALNERDKTKWVKEFYWVLSTFSFVNSTPTLFNSGTTHSQMSSCYVNTVQDSIWEESFDHPVGDGIFGTITECALLSKFAGGIGTDWTRVRPSGSHIKSTNGMSSGIVPYMKIFNDTAVAVNQGGKRNGSFAAYLEPWHGDIERFMVLKKPNGDERLRAREIFPALWTNDLFMERVRDQQNWSLFCSHQHPELHELHGEAFKEAYEAAEAAGDAIKVVDAEVLWRKIITALVESGAPWITFKDEHNRRNPQDHVGVIHNSNLCTEISLNNSDNETAVCNLGSINMAQVTPQDFPVVVPIAMRMLDNVIDLNFYPTEKSRISNLKHRPVGLGIMGWTDYVVGLGIDWESNEHLRLTDEVFEKFSYWAIKGSVMLARERGAYESFEGSKWSRGILPIDTARALPVEWLSRTSDVDWDDLAELVQHFGMRNSNCTSIAPTATIANIVGTTPCIETVFKQVFVKENKSGKFKVVDPALRHGRPELCKVAFHIDQSWIVKAAAVRQQYLCQSQSVNLFKKIGVKGREISDWYFLAWELGLKSTYYLKQQINELTHEEAGTSVQLELNEKFETPTVEKESVTVPGVVCSIDAGPDCEACQ